jgi:threonine dehydrogenase-like Zn-dependent dehydrogenase
MKALQVITPRSFTCVETPVPDLKSLAPGRILVKPQWVSMCGSDIPFFTGGKRHKTYPLPVGAPIHECTGTVVDSTSPQFKKGDWVVAIPENDQGLSEFFVGQAAKAVKLPPGTEGDGALCLVQPLSTVMNAVDRLENLEGKTVAVVGLGSIGLFFCWLLKKRGVKHITGVDPSAQRCQIAQEYGADTVFPMRSIEAVQQARQNPSFWSPPEIIIEAVGHQMETLNDCFELVQKRGTVLAFGVPDQPVYAVEYETLFRKNLHIIASVTPVWSEYLVKAREEFLSAREELGRLVTHRFSIRDAGKAFGLYESHEDGIIKALIDMSDW